MKTLQNNFTTPEQSNRLLELGVPADSANCYYETFCSDNQNDFRLELRQNPLELSNNLFSDYPHLIPCWSACRLMEIIKICSDVPIDWTGGLNEEREILEVVDSTLYALCLGKHMDFSKLED